MGHTKQFSGWWLENWELFLFLIVSAVSIILNLFDLLTEKTTIQILLVMVVAFSLYQISENRKISQSIRAIGSETEAKARRVDQREFYVFLKKAVLTAENSVDLTHIQPSPPEKAGIKEKDEYFEAIKKVIKKRQIRVRRIVSIPTMDKLNWIKSLLKEFENYPNFDIHCVDVGSLKFPVPLLSVQIVDSDQVFLIDLAKGYHFDSSWSREKNDLWIVSKEIAKSYREYYEEYWQSTEKIKEGDRTYWDNVAKIETALQAKVD